MTRDHGAYEQLRWMRARYTLTSLWCRRGESEFLDVRCDAQPVACVKHVPSIRDDDVQVERVVVRQHYDCVRAVTFRSARLDQNDSSVDLFEQRPGVGRAHFCTHRQ